ncbi:HemK2/MTQ2 family protein methyltransferase [Streptomyces longispororuber]|uniref:HemK2/MTQ2 family protein methyltransferase n=1 Tax=Streptomyces longispororuber TaxID=68230 RepID=UPI0021097B1B|nr:HemK2/MTQ2 family protein methyltransferase [Streptomyces longispororuber]MCQ4205576.1 methyltransferase [Streptomyces longispororuber]
MARSGLRLLSPYGVYAPQADTWLLLRALNDEDVGERTTAVDLGTGSGAVAVAAALRGARVTALDVAWRAVWTARLNAWLNGASITVRRGDLAAVGTGLEDASFDLVVSNPPYVPSAPGRRAPRGAARAWEGGAGGRGVVDRVCATAARVLRPGGTLLMVHSELCGVTQTIEGLGALGMAARVMDRAQVPFGPVTRGRRDWLCAQGYLDGDAEKEGLVIVRAERS